MSCNQPHSAVGWMITQVSVNTFRWDKHAIIKLSRFVSNTECLDIVCVVLHHSGNTFHSPAAYQRKISLGFTHFAWSNMSINKQQRTTCHCYHNMLCLLFTFCSYTTHLVEELVVFSSPQEELNKMVIVFAIHCQIVESHLVGESAKQIENMRATVMFVSRDCIIAVESYLTWSWWCARRHCLYVSVNWVYVQRGHHLIGPYTRRNAFREALWLCCNFLRIPKRPNNHSGAVRSSAASDLERVESDRYWP